jgi:hypothetical protein
MSGRDLHLRETRLPNGWCTMSTLRAKLTQFAKSPAARAALEKARLAAAKPENRQRLNKILRRPNKKP